MDALSIVQRLGQGRLLEELAEALAAAATEVVETGQPATVTLALKLSNHGQGDPVVIIAEQLGRTSPKRAPRGAIFWALGGELHHDDPRQTRMEFRTVDTATGEIREPRAREQVVRETR